MSSLFIHVVTLSECHSFSCLNNISLYEIYHIFKIHSSVDGHFGSIHLLEIVINAAVIIGMRTSVWISALFSLEYIPRSGWWVIRYFWETAKLFPGCCSILHFHKQCKGVPITPNPHQRLLSIFKVVAILVCVKCYLTLVLICISLNVNAVEHLSMCLFSHFLIELSFCCWVVKILYIF